MIFDIHMRKHNIRRFNDIFGVILSDKDQKKQIPLRLSQSLWNDLAEWANDEFRSVNGQIEYLLSECVKRRKHGADTHTPVKRDGAGE
jgi:hypothetical protein